MSDSVFRLSILDSNNKIIVKGLHSAYVEPLRSVLFNTFNINIEKNSQLQLQFTAYNDGSVAYNMLSVESSVFWNNQEWIIKQAVPDYSNGFESITVTAIHVSYEVSRIRQRQVKAGTLTYTVDDVLSFYLSNNSLGYTWQVIGTFSKEQITDLGNGSGKDMLDKIISTWPDAIFYPDNKNIRIYQHDSLAKNVGNRIDYLHDTPEVRLTYDSTNIVNQVMAYGKQKESADSHSNTTEYYFEPFLVTNEKSVGEWGLHPGENISDERFTDKSAMQTYALSQLTPEPTLTIEIKELTNEQPVLSEVRRLEIRKYSFVTEVEIVSYTYYPLDKAQATSIMLNNRAKTILNYKSAQQSALQKAINVQKKKVRQAEEKARKAYNSRLIGKRVETVPADSLTRDVRNTSVNSIPLYVLEMAEDNTDFGLPKGSQIAVRTTADGVEGLDQKIQAGQIKYDLATDKNNGLMSALDKVKLDQLENLQPATNTVDGLMTAADKIKLDKLKQEPVDAIQIKDSSTGSIYNLTINNGEIEITEAK